MTYELVPCVNGHITCFHVNSTNKDYHYSKTDFLVYPLVTSTTGGALPNNNTASTILSHTTHTVCTSTTEPKVQLKFCFAY